MTQATDKTAILRVMREILANDAFDGGDAFDPVAGDPDLAFVNLTRLAEEAAFELGHDEWLDDETHDVWVLAITAAEAFAKEAAA